MLDAGYWIKQKAFLIIIKYLETSIQHHVISCCQMWIQNLT